MIDVKSIASRVVVRGLVSITTEERDELLSWEQAAYAAEEANERCAELERHQAEDQAAIREMNDALVNIRDDAYQLAREVVEPGEKRAWTAIAVIANKPVRDNTAAIQRAREGKS